MDSQVVAAVIIGGCGFVGTVITLLARRYRARNRSNAIEKTPRRGPSPPEMKTFSSNNTAENTSQDIPSEKTTEEKTICDIDPRDVFTFVSNEKLTELQLATRKDKYSGKRVRWRGRVIAITEPCGMERIILLHFTIEENRNIDSLFKNSVVAIFTNIMEIEQKLMTLQKGEGVVIEGTIDFSGRNIKLREPRIVDYYKPSDLSSSSSNATSSNSRKYNSPIDKKIFLTDLGNISRDRSRTTIQVEPELEKYNGRRVRISGVVLDIDNQLIGSGYRMTLVEEIERIEIPLSIESGKEGLVVAFPKAVDTMSLAENEEEDSVSAGFEQDQHDQLILINPGDKVTLVGTILVLGRHFSLESCIIEKHLRGKGGKPQ